MYEIKINSNKNNLEKVLSFIGECVDPFNVSMKFKLQLELAIEEIFINIVNYAYVDEISQDNEIKIICDIQENPLKIIIKFIDSGEPFNPLEIANPDVSADIENRNVGGLGLFLVKKNVDNINYEYIDNNVLTIEKYLD